METKLDMIFGEALITQHAEKWDVRIQRRNRAKGRGICQIMRALNVILRHFYLILMDSSLKTYFLQQENYFFNGNCVG